LPRAGIALLGALLIGAMLAPATAGAEKKVRLRLTIPDAGQLAVARIEFKAKDEDKPKLKLQAKNEEQLSDQVVVVAQSARVKNKDGRAVGIVGIANVPPSGARAAGGTPTPQVLIEARIVQSDIKFLRNVGHSFGFVNTLGPESHQVHEQARDLFHLPPSKMQVDAEGRLTLDLPGLKLVGPAKTLAGQAALGDISVEDVAASAVASGLGHPAALDARVYTRASGEPFPALTSYDYQPSPGDPRVIFNQAAYSRLISGAQVSQSGNNDVLHTKAAACSTGGGQFGSVSWEVGPGGGYSLVCNLPAFDDQLFFDVPFAQPPQEPDVVGRLLPIPFYPGDTPGGEIGEAIGGPGITAGIG